MPDQQATAPRIAAVVLAAGLSRRAGSRNKLLFDWQGQPMLRVVVQTILAAGLAEPIVVLGHEAGPLRAALAGTPARCVVNAAYAQGMAGSIATGIAAVPADDAGALICLGDMPAIRASTLQALADAFTLAEAPRPCVPVQAGRWGNPVLWPRAAFADLLALQGDRGAKALLQAARWAPHEVAVDDPGIHRDIDTAADLPG